MSDNEYAFTISGCDDNTFLVLNLDDDQAKVLRNFAERVNRRSGYACQPTINVREATDADIDQDTELEAETVEREKEASA